jgi:D-alanyl-D-alanine carboxypeptidase/D-alanyl-D-alanine-endopeptidase (penicillin-binding protein 4)
MRSRTLVIVPSILLGWACAHARTGDAEAPTPKLALTPPARTAPASQPAAAPASQPAARRLSPDEERRRLEELRRRVAAELASPVLARAKVSLLAARLVRTRGHAASQPASAPTSRPAGRELLPLLAVNPDVPRLPASNAKLLTTAASALVLPGRVRFVTEVSTARGTLYLHGTGDPVLRRADLQRLAAAVRAKGIGAVRGIVVDDSTFDRQRLAPGFEAFAEGSHYRPTSGALNLDANVIQIQVSAPADRKRPRVDVSPPSDYVVVRKQVRTTRARRCPEACKADVTVRVEARGATMRLVIAGTIGRKARPWSTRRAVLDPGLNAGWALRRALAEAGIAVKGGVRRGKRPGKATVLARRAHALADVLLVTNRDSDNLAAETLVRAMSYLPPIGREPARSEAGQGGFALGLRRLKEALALLGLEGAVMGNGSGLHRGTRVTARQLVQVLREMHERPALRRALLPTLAVAGRSGTLGGRLRGTEAEAHLHGKTGTLGGALALSGSVDPGSEEPLLFSILVNGRSDHAVRDAIDRIAALLATYARGLPFAARPTSAPASQPSDEDDADSSGS